MIKKKALYKKSSWQRKFLIHVNSLLKQQTQYKENLLVLNEQVFFCSEVQKEKICENLRDLRKQTFHFLNKTISFDNELGWHDSKISQLWRYNLHYFDYFRDLIEAELINPSEENFLLLKSYVKSWIHHNRQVGIGDGWHPYTISLRLVNWIYAYSAFYTYLINDSEFKRDFLHSIISQVNFLLRNLEFDVYGNHLFENLKTLTITGLFLGESPLGKQCLSIAEKEMKKELAEQFLSDGGHFELSAMYHSILLKGLSEIIHAYYRIGKQPPIEFQQTEYQALVYLKNILHPDGQIPLLNDAAFGIAKSPDYLFAFSSCLNFKGNLSIFDQVLNSSTNMKEKKQAIDESLVFFAKDSGYLKLKDERVFLFIDFGKVCPDYLPAHAHADMFSYEMSFDGKRLVVDTGTYEYVAGKNREYDRSTVAHNTLTINRENQSNVWGSFRVAERAFPVVKKFENTKEYNDLIVEHDGYKKRFDVSHRRRFIHIPNKVFIVLDTVLGGDGDHSIESFIHLAPGTVLKEHGEEIFLDNELKISLLNASAVTSNSVYHPEFGMEKENKKIILQPLVDKAPIRFGYAFLYDKYINVSLSGSDICISTENDKWTFQGN